MSPRVYRRTVSVPSLVSTTYTRHARNGTVSDGEASANRVQNVLNIAAIAHVPDLLAYPRESELPVFATAAFLYLLLQSEIGIV